MKSLASIALTLLMTPALAQTYAHDSQQGHAPYAGLENRQIKAVSDEQISDLRAGRGMSLALAAELNGYPGPSHALELAQPLALTSEQRARTQSLFVQMKRSATALGAHLIENEQRLDALFASGAATSANVAAATAETASLHGELRALHLKYHLEMKSLLSPQQVARYNELRGYGTTAHAH
jgi:Spy/CpxP family protein refolding chaperone